MVWDTGAGAGTGAGTRCCCMGFGTAVFDDGCAGRDCGKADRTQKVQGTIDGTIDGNNRCMEELWKG